MRIDIKDVIDNCEACERFQAKFNSVPALHPISVIPIAWHSLGVDVLGPSPTSVTGRRYVIVAINYFTKWVEAKDMNTQGTAETAVVLTEIFDRLGAPAKFRTDQSTHVQGVLRKYCRLTWLTTTCPGPTTHSRTD